jgi:hypothetical protein
MNRKMRFVYAAANSGGDIVSYHDAVALWAKGPEPVAVVVPGRAAGVVGVVGDGTKREGLVALSTHKGQDVARALLFPGLGQFSAGQKSKGAFLAVAGVVGGVVGVIGKAGMSAPLAAGQAAVDALSRDPSTLAVQQNNYYRAKSDFDAQRSKALLGGAVYAAAWLYGIIDASIGSAPR